VHRLGGADRATAVRVAVHTLRLDGGTQPRAVIDQTVVREYAQAMTEGAEFPPVIVFDDGEQRWLADGFHRTWGAQAAGLKTIDATIRKGGQREAILYAVGANAAHGLRRTNDDKRRAALLLLNDPEWSQWSDREIARRCAVSNRFVSDLRAELAPTPSVNGSQIARKVKRKGKVYRQKGKKPKTQPQPSQPEDPAAKATATENERRKLFSVRVIQVLEAYATTDITPARAVEEFFAPIAHDVEPSLEAAVRWFSEFARLWRAKYERSKRAA
jgi:ParB-like chromosome segregation protein Spo0J